MKKGSFLAPEREALVAATLVLLWPLLNTCDALRAWQVDRDVQCPLARQQGSAGSPQGAAVGSFPKHEQQQQPSLSRAKMAGWQANSTLFLICYCGGFLSLPPVF